MCKKSNGKIQEVISTEEYLIKRKHMKNAEIKIIEPIEKEAAITNAAMEIAYLYV